MTALLRFYDAAADRAQALAGPALPSLARLLFAGILLLYYWGSALTKVGDSALSPASGAYIQIFPKAVEAVGYDVSKLSGFHTLVVLAGTAAEFLLPALIVAGLFTRLAALGMIGFVAVQSWVDVFGHGLAGPDIGAWFDRDPSALLLDQRALWLFLLTVLVLKGAGPLSADRLLASRSR
jgi:putative oxidoreductase